MKNSVKILLGDNMKTLTIFFLLFLIYSFIGWSIEVIRTLIIEKKFINRGFLIGPICPIYGYASIIMIICLQKYSKDIIALFMMAILVCSILEYFTSLIMEKIFKARWWDYSNRKFNINGRICLETMVPFGILGVFLIKFLNPFIMNIINFLDIKILSIITLCLFIIYIIDNFISFGVMSKIHLSKLKINSDNTEEITVQVRKILKGKPLLIKRLADAFPNMKIYQLKKRRK